LRAYEAVKLVKDVRNCDDFVAPVDVKTVDIHLVGVEFDVLNCTESFYCHEANVYSFTCIEDFPCLIYSGAVADI
jgi:hypothetical protein